MVQLLITSDIAKYCEFKTVTRMLTLMDDKLERVSLLYIYKYINKIVLILYLHYIVEEIFRCLYVCKTNYLGYSRNSTN